MLNQTAAKYVIAAAAVFSVVACGKKEEAPVAPSAPVSRITPEQLEQQRQEVAARIQEEANARAARQAAAEKERAVREAADAKQRAIDEEEEARQQAAQEAAQKAENARLEPQAIAILEKENQKLKTKLAAVVQDPFSLDKRGRVYFDPDDNTGSIYTASREIELYDATQPTWNTEEDDKGVNQIADGSVSDDTEHDQTVGTIYRPGKAFYVDLNSNKICAVDMPEVQTIAPSEDEEEPPQKGKRKKPSVDRRNFLDADSSECPSIKAFATEGSALLPDIQLLQNAARAKAAKLTAPTPK